MRFKRTALSAAVVMAMAAGAVNAAPKTWTSRTTFSMDNLIGDFNGTMIGTMGNGSDQSIVCGASAIYPGSPACPPDDGDPATLEPQPKGGDEAPMLYPIDSEFGFNVVPFAKAVPKVRGDGVWGEGWVGNIYDGDTVIGLEFSDADTDTFVVPDGQGTWCTGLGTESVKCSTEHYTVMEQLLTCHETIPYLFADPVTGEQQKILDPADGTTVLVDCADKKLDSNLYVINKSLPAVDGKMTGAAAILKDGTAVDVIDWTTPGIDPDSPLTFMEPNEASVLDDIAWGEDYAMSSKDDGKALFRWGNLIKKPNDIRIYARMVVPLPWRQLPAVSANGGKGYRITKAELVVNHKVTNNPNDQIRPEDMENEGATGRLPGYTISGNKWLSDRDCYQGNGIFIPTGTVLKNGDFVLPDTAVPVTSWDENPYGWSADLTAGNTAGWYTTIDREPFEWSYDTNGDGASDGSVRSPDLLPAGSTLLSGPRWRLTPNKIGQDIPGLEVPNVECAPPPYQKDLIKYDVGAPIQTVINLLDWKSTDARSIDGESPLVWSKGWVTNGWFNDGTIVNPDVTAVNPAIFGVTINGSPVTRGFDLTFYVKGDKKPTAIYNATLRVEWDDSTNWVPPAE